MSVPTPPSSPAPSSASDDFASLVDAELAAAASDDEGDADASEDDDWEGEEEAERGREEEDIEHLRYKRLKMDGQVDVAITAANVLGEKGGCPPHPGFMWGVCIRCGQLKPTPEPGDNNVALKYIHEEFELAEDEITRLRGNELEQVLTQKKLFLVLDLDHTILNSARFIELPPEETTYLEDTYFGADVSQEKTSNVPDGAPAIAGPIQAGWGGLYRLSGLHMWTKLRPFAHKFLEEASKLFELYVYTMGERTYALTMAHLLDPTGKHFKGRIISQRDSTRRHSKDLDIVLGAESAVAILDDTEGVWPKHKPNLILMERYHFFTSSCMHFGLQSPSLADAQRDESETEGTLANTLNVLRRIHSNFFSAARNGGDLDCVHGNDIRQVVMEMRSKILLGCRIVFSRIFPIGLTEPELHPLWRLTEELGAECMVTTDDLVTHVVALDRGTEKAKWAKQHGKYLVHPAWIEAAQYLWCRASESEFPVREGQMRSPVFTFAKTLDISMIKEQHIAMQKVSNSGNAEGNEQCDSLKEQHMAVSNLGNAEANEQCDSLKEQHMAMQKVSNSGNAEGNEQCDSLKEQHMAMQKVSNSGDAEGNEHCDSREAENAID